jgi:hypothetical protein
MLRGTSFRPGFPRPRLSVPASRHSSYEFKAPNNRLLCWWCHHQGGGLSNIRGSPPTIFAQTERFADGPTSVKQGHSRYHEWPFNSTPYERPVFQPHRTFSSRSWAFGASGSAWDVPQYPGIALAAPVAPNHWFDEV